MKLSKWLRLNIDTLVIEHPAFVAVRQAILDAVTDTIDGLPSEVLVLLGPTQAGKSKMLRTIAEAYPPTRIEGRLQVLVLYISLPPGVALKDLPKYVIRALGIRRGAKFRTAGELFGEMCDLLKNASVRAILFDEGNHLVDIGHRILPRQAADWFKHLNELANISIVVAGIPRLRALLQRNEQVRGRAPRAIELLPYRWDRRDERLNFAGCVRAFLDLFENEGCIVEMTMDAFVRYAYLVSAGHVGLLARFFVELAKPLDTPQPITLAALQAAASKLNPPGGVETAPFSTQPPTDDLLMEVLSAALAENDIVLPPDPGLAEVGHLRSKMQQAPRKTRGRK
ncbi:hypothetical protein GCM10025771_08090 [Niveibacterium umoris]|uniref:AAA+ ATPase domain-containing protein n=1 Tax=Niveibacterium umoris TaxID=1193620 RepID=A0A840BMB4_9RHOO|nr:TniB family NTP-binding protein [Niveibacterium umoris]MBB4013644.1 hypothetical protein [Niveibacterium umoris]